MFSYLQKQIMEKLEYDKKQKERKEVLLANLKTNRKQMSDLYAKRDRVCYNSEVTTLCKFISDDMVRYSRQIAMDFSQLKDNHNMSQEEVITKLGE